MGGYISGLDLVRCFAAVLVAVFHLSWHYPASEITLDAGWVGGEIFL
jgi:peptidoglycan/LPS O-acetylase OafA/YrhL